MGYEVGQNCQINNKQAYPERGNTVGQLNNFQRQKGCCDDCREVFSPHLLIHQADSFKKADRGVAKHEAADLSQTMIVEQGDFFKKKGDESAFRIPMERLGQIRKHVPEVFVYQPQDTETDADEKCSLKELVNGNQFQPAIPSLPI
jgi:hypothetical protein